MEETYALAPSVHTLYISLVLRKVCEGTCCDR